MLQYPARIELGHLPTPLEEMPRLSEALGGPRLFIKRDDETGLATGGNKTRKLEFLVADALEGGADTVITAGAAQSNHCRQTAAAAAKCGLKCILTLTGSDPGVWNGNLLLDDLLGAEVRFVGDVTWTGLLDVMAGVADELRVGGGRPYVIPVGGSNPVGATGYVAAMEEFIGQLKERSLNIDHVVFASSSGGTQSGLVVGARAFGFKGQVLGISVASKVDDLMGVLVQLSTDTAKGYGKPAEPEREAIRLLAQTEGILADPVYTGRALAGLIDLIRKGTFNKDETVLFWHTGGSAALFAYVKELLGP